MNYQDMVTAYALGELTEQEQALFEAQAGPELVAEARELREMLADLGGSLTPIAPPPGLKARVMEAVEHLPQEPQLEPTGPTLAPLGEALKQAEPTDQAVQPKQAPAQTSPARSWQALFALAASVSAICLGIWNLQSQQALEEARQEISALSASRDSLIDQISRADDVSLAKGSMEGSSISVLYSPSHNMAGITTSGLPQLPEGQVYMIWLYDASGQVVGSGTLTGSASGPVMSEMTDQDLSAVTDFGISVESVGSTSPSQKPMMLEKMTSAS